MMAGKFLTCAAIVALFATNLCADEITLGTSDLVTMNPGTISSTIQITINNNVNPDPPADFMTGWQFGLLIVADAGAVGSVTFNSPLTGPASNPANYIFQSTTSFGIAATNSGVGMLAFDFEFPLGAGIEVPVAGANLLDVNFLATPGAAGTFGIFALGDPGQTEWTDALFGAREYINVPNGAGLRTRIGQITVIPEPCGGLGLAGLLGIAWCFRRRRS